MSLLVNEAWLQARRSIAQGSLSGLATGLRTELARVIAEPPQVPREKAMLSRAGGRCARDGTLLTFDPWDARHICPSCGLEHVGGLHDRFRLYWYQLWLAERSLHAALLGVVLDDAACRETAMALLEAQAEQYLRFPNADNVLGPSRPFFSTYLESIWLLQLIIALDILETGARSPEVLTLGARVRDRLIVPGVALIASFDEGMSNRQVWNNAAIMAGARLLDDRVRFDRALHGRSGLHAHLKEALLSDGSWYEAENYHLFAHRGLWYGATLAASAGQPLPAALAERFHEGFAAPFRTVLPDLTYPSRRDSQHAVSIRQPRFAESCELGLAAHDDDRLTGVLARLYDPAIPRGETGRRESSADVERNVAATGLTRDDLSWRSLLFARETLPALIQSSPSSDLLPAQGLGILRRDDGALYVSLDYGHSGGGHGHPDRLNLTLAHRLDRWFDDPGTGSYVDPTLHWYRSTLAHHAPLVDGHSQPRVNGALVAFADDRHVGWISAYAELAPGLRVTRTVVVHADYIVDELGWDGAYAHEITLTIHGVTITGDHERVPAIIDGGTDAEDGFAFLAESADVTHASGGAIRLTSTGSSGALLCGWVFVAADATLFSALAPPPPECRAPLPVVLLRQAAERGQFLAVWSWDDSVASVVRDGDVLVVLHRDGSRHRHRRVAQRWLVERSHRGDTELNELSGIVTGTESGAAPDIEPLPESEPKSAIPLPATIELGERHYRRSEFTWQGAGAPRATVMVTRPTPGTVLVQVDVPSSQRLFVPLIAENQLDNEPASINGDSVQLYAVVGFRDAGLLFVPQGGSVGCRPVDGWANDLAVDARWWPASDGYHLEATLHIDGRTPEFALDVLINEVVPGRARRRGQLVMSGATGEFVYLRGDRHDASRLLCFALGSA